MRVVLYREEDGRCPFLEWFERLPSKAQDKCYTRLERLRLLGYELRRPEADYLRNAGGIHYRVLYFFHGRTVVVVSHGITKEQAIPVREINAAVKRKERFAMAPSRHTFEEF